MAFARCVGWGFGVKNAKSSSSRMYGDEMRKQPTKQYITESKKRKRENQTNQMRKEIVHFTVNDMEGRNGIEYRSKGFRVWIRGCYVDEKPT